MRPARYLKGLPQKLKIDEQPFISINYGFGKRCNPSNDRVVAEGMDEKLGEIILFDYIYFCLIAEVDMFSFDNDDLSEQLIIMAFQTFDDNLSESVNNRLLNNLFENLTKDDISNKLELLLMILKNIEIKINQYTLEISLVTNWTKNDFLKLKQISQFKIFTNKLILSLNWEKYNLEKKLDLILKFKEFDFIYLTIPIKGGEKCQKFFFLSFKSYEETLLKTVVQKIFDIKICYSFVNIEYIDRLKSFIEKYENNILSESQKLF